jgi:bla regulator protein blaR1
MFQLFADHLWQSTLCAGAAALLTLMLRRNQARLRYLVWLAASLKFLLPFALLVAIARPFGIQAPSAEPPDALEVRITSLMDYVSRPFSRPAPDGSAAPLADAAPSVSAIAQPVLITIWFAGAVGVLGLWLLRCRRIARVIRSAAPLSDARVIGALDRIARARGVRESVRAVASETTLEPGIFGLARPVLIWPQGISVRLSEEQIEAILVHELCHVARRDNLAAAAHVVVQAMFWFHPMVWWIGARLVNERERACDEAVLQAGSDPDVYAESILKTCQYSVEAPVLCMAGVTGPELSKRMEHIMSTDAGQKLNRTKKAILAAAAASAVVGPIGIGLLHGPRVQAQAQTTAGADRPSFEVASVKPNTTTGPGPMRIGFPGNGRFNVTNMALRELIRFAYEVQPFQITGGPGWIDNERFDVTATTAGNPGPAVMRQMLQSLLAERFKLGVHTETREMPTYDLLVARSDGRLGEKLRAAGPDCAPLTIPAGFPAPPPPPPGGAVGRGGPGGPAGGCSIIMGPGFISARRTTMEQLTRTLAPRVRRIVIDRTGLSGFYDADLEFAAEFPMQPPPGAPPLPPPNPDAPSIYTAVQEQLGLKLESSRGPVEVLVIDQVEALIPD